MKLSSILLCGIIQCAFACDAAAFLGDDSTMIERIYGPTTGMASIGGAQGEIWKYDCNGFEISVTLVDGKSAREVFTKQTRGGLSAEALAAFLRAHAGGKVWHEMPNSSSGNRQWERDGAVAVYINHPDYVTFAVALAGDAQNGAAR